MLTYPLSDDGYAAPVECVDLCKTMSKYNVAVLQILTREEQKASQAALYSEMGKTPTSVTSDPKTWSKENFRTPSSPFLSQDYAISEQAFKNRVHPKLVDAFAALYGTHDVLTTIDFWGFKRGTLHNPAWKLPPLRLHWDVDIARYVQDQKRGRRRYQALLALNDNSQTIGSFACVPGSANMLHTFQPDVHQKKYVKNSSILQQNIQRLPLKAGCVVIWDVGTAHANFANHDWEPRLTQYCRMIPNTKWAQQAEPQNIVNYWRSLPVAKRSQIQSPLFQLFDQGKILGLDKTLLF